MYTVSKRKKATLIFDITLSSFEIFLQFLKQLCPVYELGITRETLVIPGIRNSSILSTSNLGLSSE